MKITETNCETGETTTREMTPAEIESAKIIAVEKEENELADAAKIAAKESALAKLQAIGLTEEEAKSIVG